MMSPETVQVYVVLQDGMIELPWTDEWGSGDFEPKDAVEQASQKLRAGEALYGRMIGDAGPSETWRWIAVEPRSIVLVFANA